jgi:hypothetical protein
MSDNGTHPEIPDRNWTNPFPEGHPLHDLYHRRITNGQDLVILIDDYHSRRGTGKTVASLQLAQGMDQNGPLTWENVSMSPQEIRNAYTSLPQRSSVVLDEGEVGAGSRDTQTKSNKALNEIMSMGRVEQKYVVVNTPSIGFIDKNLRELADVWISMVAKGLGLVHFFKRQPYGNQGTGKLLTEKQGMIQFSDIERGTQLRDVYNQLTEEKRKHISGDKGEGFVPQSEHREALEKAREETRKDTRNEIIQDVYRGLSGFDDDDYTRMKRADGVSQAMLGEAVGLSQQQVANIVRDT